jgi:hypothetical protein
MLTDQRRGLESAKWTQAIANGRASEAPRSQLGGKNPESDL